MKISYTPPPNYEEIQKTFELPEDKIIYFTYGDTCYCPKGNSISDDLIRHEETHVEQQQASGEVAALWWQRYLRDPVFRLEQEAEAYGAQYHFLCQKFKDRNKRAKLLWEMAEFLSGAIYGNAATHAEAMKIIKDFAEMGKPEQQI